MNRIFFPVILAVVFLSSGCAVQHKSLSGIRNWSYPQHQMDSLISFSFVENVLDKSGNNRQSKWADRKGIEIISIRLINNTKKPIHGTQIDFRLNGEKPEIIHNKWLARKVRQRVSPFIILALPLLIIEEVLFYRHDDEDNNFYVGDTYYIGDNEREYVTNKVVKQEEEDREEANFNLQKELMKSQLAGKILYPGRPVYGIIGIKTDKKLDNLKVLVKQTGSELF